MAELEVIRYPIKRALELAEELRDKRVNQIGTTEDVNLDLENLRATMASLLPIEHHARKELEIQEKQLVRKKLLSESNVLANDFPPFPMEALTWRNKLGFPKLAVFSITSPTMKLGTVTTHYGWSGRRGYAKTHAPIMTREMLKLYADVFAKTKTMAQAAKKSVSLEATFEGIIPLDVKEHIANTKSLFKQTYVVAEVKNWNVEQTAAREVTRTAHGDPLVMGFDGMEYWLIASFDTTTIEKYAESIALKNVKSE